MEGEEGGEGDERRESIEKGGREDETQGRGER